MMSLMKMQKHVAGRTAPPQRWCLCEVGYYQRASRHWQTALSFRVNSIQGKPFVCTFKVLQRWGNDIYLSVSSYGSSPAVAYERSDEDRSNKTDSVAVTYISADASTHINVGAASSWISGIRGIREMKGRYLALSSYLKAVKKIFNLFHIFHENFWLNDWPDK